MMSKGLLAAASVAALVCSIGPAGAGAADKLAGAILKWTGFGPRIAHVEEFRAGYRLTGPAESDFATMSLQGFRSRPFYLSDDSVRAYELGKKTKDMTSEMMQL